MKVPYIWACISPFSLEVNYKGVTGFYPPRLLDVRYRLNILNVLLSKVMSVMLADGRSWSSV